MNDPKDCRHEDFNAIVTVRRVSEHEGGPVTGFVAEIEISCAGCNLPFEFKGLPTGYSKENPIVSTDFKKAMLPIVPYDKEIKKEIIYTEHVAGTFEQGLQVCILCGHVICDYTGHWMSNDGSEIKGYPEGKIYITGTNPIQTTTIKPLENYGLEDPYIRKIKKCVDK